MTRLLLALALLLPVAACDTISDAVDEAACSATGYADSGFVRATVSGDTFSGTCVRVQIESGALTVVGGDNVVSNDEQEVLAVTFPSTDLRTYELGVATAFASFTRRTPDSGSQAEEVYVATTGTVTLSEFSATTARGTFSFTARNQAGQTVSVTGGSFDVTY